MSVCVCARARTCVYVKPELQCLLIKLNVNVAGIVAHALSGKKKLPLFCTRPFTANTIIF